MLLMRASIAGIRPGQDRNDQVTIPASSVPQISVPWKLEPDCESEDSRATTEIAQSESDTAASFDKQTIDEANIESVKTVLVPVRDPLTKQVRNVLVPVEVRDETGLNIIKSVLVPVHADDGVVSYEVKRYLVPIKPELTLPRRRRYDKSASNKPKGKEIRENKVVKRNEGKETFKLGTEEVQGKKGDSDQSHILDTLTTTCPLCQRYFKDVSSMQKHVRKIHRKSYRCDKCSKKYLSDYALEEHLKTHEGASFHQCSICYMQYKTPSSLRNHYVRKHSNIEANFMCDYCGKRYKLKYDLTAHIDRSHMNPRHVCRYCGMTVNNIAQHELSHERSKQIAPSFRCQLCRRTFKASNRLENHLLMKHRGSKEGSDMLRTLCENKFNSSLDFYKHVHSKSETMQYKCNDCGKLFATEENLRSHIPLHLQTFVCSNCEKAFSSNYSLKQHMRKHTGERPYQCKECLKSFARSASLRVHNLTHTGQKPYVCDICGHKFTQRSSMMAHRKKHPGDHPPPPPIILRELRGRRS